MGLVANIESRQWRRELNIKNNILSVRGDTSVRTKFHNVPIDLLPPPGARNTHVLEHSYALNSSNK